MNSCKTLCVNPLKHNFSKTFQEALMGDDPGGPYIPLQFICLIIYDILPY